MKKLSYIIILSLLLFKIESFAFAIESDLGTVYDFNNKEIIFSKNIDETCIPSSLTKIMVAYLVFDYLEQGIIRLDEKFKVSIRAWRQDGTRMFLEPEWKIIIDDLLKGMLVVSGNDAAVVLAEGIAGTIDDFVLLMNKKAKELGMRTTNFTNPTGLFEDVHYTTLRDLIILTEALIKNHKKYYDKYFSIKDFTFNNIKQKNRNLLLDIYKGTDGIKTGTTKEGGMGLIASAEQNNLRLISIVNQAKDEKTRAKDSVALLNYGFSQYKYLDLFRKHQPIIYVEELLFDEKQVYLYSKEDIIYPFKKSHLKDIDVKIIYHFSKKKRIFKGEQVAVLRIIEQGKITDYPLFANATLKPLTKIERLFQYFKENCNKLLLI